MRVPVLFACVVALAVVNAACGGGGGGGGGGPASSEARLASLMPSAGALAPTFSADTTAYTDGVGRFSASVTLLATAVDPGAAILVDGQPVASGAQSQSLALAIGVPRPVDVKVTAADGVTQTTYTVVFSRASSAIQEAYVKASNTGATDEFGISVAIDGNTLAVGARHEDSSTTGVNGDPANNSATDSGAVYVFVRNGATWTQQAYLKASNTGAGDRFGFAVALAGDTLVVGAPGEDSSATGVNGNQADNSGTDSGAVYVFVRSGTNWTQQAYVKASNTSAGDVFGGAVAISTDTLVVGADADATTTGGARDGSAYVFVRSGGAWTQQAFLKASNAAVDDEFGFSVAVSGDTLVVGATGEDSGATGVNGSQADNSVSEAGAAYVFVRSGTAWTQQAYLKASNTITYFGQGSEFGWSVDVSDDTLVVGAHLESSNATGVNGNGANISAPFSGAAYVFVRSGTAWSQEAYVKASDSTNGIEFGTVVALDGDALVVGAPLVGVNTGAAYVFLRSGTSWTQLAPLTGSNTESQDMFGVSAALGGDTVAVGARRESSNATGVNGDGADNSAGQSGAAYVFR